MQSDKSETAGSCKSETGDFARDAPLALSGWARGEQGLV